MVIWHRYQNHPPVCPRTGKPGYDKKGAQTAINKRMKGRKAPQTLRAFECRHCGRWHLTSKELR